MSRGVGEHAVSVRVDGGCCGLNSYRFQFLQDGLHNGAHHGNGCSVRDPHRHKHGDGDQTEIKTENIIQTYICFEIIIILLTESRLLIFFHDKYQTKYNHFVNITIKIVSNCCRI